MEMQIIREFLNMQLDAIDNTENKSEAGALMLLMADYLFELVEKEPEIFTAADEKKLRMLFLRCGRTGERLRNFYEKYRQPIQESATPILQRIQTTNEVIKGNQQMIDEYEKSIHKLEEDNKELLNCQERLEETKKHFEELERSVSECKQIMESITPEILNAKENERCELKEQVEVLTEGNDRLDKEILSLKMSIEEENSKLITLNVDKKTLNEKNETQKNEILRMQEEISQSEKKNQELLHETEVLSEKIVEAGSAREKLIAELKENERIEEGILEEGFFDKQDFTHHLEDLKKQGDELVRAYDKAIGNILEDAVSVYNKIKERQRMK